MKLTLKSARDPRWSNPQNTSIDMMVVFVETESSFGENPFTASQNDAEEHGRDIFSRAAAGEFGAVATYAPPVFSDEELARQALEKRDDLLTEAGLRIAPLQDAVDIGESTAEEEAELVQWKRYRVQVNRIDQQAGYPRDIVWPVKPA